MTDQTQANSITLRRRGQKPWSTRPTRVVAVDFDGRTLHLARAVRRGEQPQITRIASRALPADDALDRTDAAALGKWLGQVLRELKLNDPLVMSVPRGQVLLRPVTLPANTAADELPAMARFQASRDLPVADDDTVIDIALEAHFDGASPGGAYDADGGAAAPAAPAGLDVLAAAVRHETVVFYRNVAAAAGAKLLALGMRAHAQARCVEACGGVERDTRTSVIHVRPDELLIDVLAGCDLVFTRAVRLPAADAPGAEQNVGASPLKRSTRAEQVAAEALRNLRSYEATQPRGKLSRVLVAGRTGVEAALASTLAHELGRVCQTLDVAASLSLPDEQRDAADDAVAAIGLAIGTLDRDGLPFDFLHPHEAPPKRDHRRLAAGLAAACFVGAVLLAYGARQNMLEPRRAALAEVTEQVRQLEDNQRFFRQAVREHETLEQWQQRRQPWADHLAYLSAILPPSDELYVTQLATATSGAMRIGVQARDTETLSQLDRALRSAGYQPRPMAVTPGNDRHGYPFRATLELTPPRDTLDVDLADHQPPARPEDDASLD